MRRAFARCSAPRCWWKDTSPASSTSSAPAPVPFTDEQIELLRTFADQAAIAVANARLMEAVERQRTELSRFVSPQVAELVSSDEGEQMLAGHRAYVTAHVLRPPRLYELHRAGRARGAVRGAARVPRGARRADPRVRRHARALCRRRAHGLLQRPCPGRRARAQGRPARARPQQRFEELGAAWRKRGHELGLGIGIAAGYATLGRIGFEGRYDYGVLGTVTNLASRLSRSAAEPGQTLISQRVYAAVEEPVDAHQVGELELKGFGRPMPAFEVRGLKP